MFKFKSGKASKNAEKLGYQTLDTLDYLIRQDYGTITPAEMEKIFEHRMDYIANLLGYCDEATMWRQEAKLGKSGKLICYEQAAGEHPEFAELLRHYQYNLSCTNVTIFGNVESGLLFGNDECFDVDGFYHYFLVGDTLYKCHYHIPTSNDGNTTDDLGDVDYNHPVAVDDVSNSYRTNDQ